MFSEKINGCFVSGSVLFAPPRMLSLRLSENIPGEDSGTNLPEGLAQEKKEPAAEAPAADSAGQREVQMRIPPTCLRLYGCC